VAGTASSRTGWRYRTNIAARALAGTIGAYAVAACFAMALARILPLEPVQAIMPATLLAFLIMPAVTIWAFLARSPWRAWGGVVLLGALFAGIAWLTGTPA